MDTRALRFFLPLSAILFAIAIGCGGPVVSNVTPGGDFSRTPPPPTPTPTAGRHHPVGFADPAMHGPYAKFVSENCPTCHGANLDGVGQPTAAYPDLPANGCDTCHTAGWRTNCTFCHGGQNDQTGASPRDITEIAGETTTNPIFASHAAHIKAGADHLAYDCTTCHNKPDSAMAPGHWIVGNVTPGFPTVTFTNGMDTTASYAGHGTQECDTSYCHGNGRANGTVTKTLIGTVTCHSCHGFKDNATSLQTMSGRHRDHVGFANGCYTCHSTTVSSADAISNPGNHVDKVKQVAFAGITMTYANGRCNGTCHGENHSNYTW